MSRPAEYTLGQLRELTKSLPDETPIAVHVDVDGFMEYVTSVARIENLLRVRSEYRDFSKPEITDKPDAISVVVL